MSNLVRLIVIVGAAACGFVLLALGLARHDSDLIAPVDIMLLALAVLVYLLPAGLAIYRDCRAKAGILVVNLLLGWTIIGWFAAMGWAASGVVKEPRRSVGSAPTHPVPGP